MEAVSEDIQDGVQPTDVSMNGEEALNEVPEELIADTDSIEEDRPGRKATRQLSRSSSGGDTTNNAVHVKTKPQPFSKNSRKSRDGRGRGLPKKGGAGGKGVWGKPGSELDEDGNTVDTHDPNYDSDSQDGNIEFEKICPAMTQEDFEKFIEPVVMEYFEHGNSADFLEELTDVNFEHLKSQLVEFLVSKALDHKDYHRELTSVLISDLYGKVLASSDVMVGFDELLSKMSDLVIDTPDASSVVGKFIARAVADDCLPPKYIMKYKGAVECAHTKAALEQADVLLNRTHGFVRLDTIWGAGGGIRPVRLLIKKIVMLLKEYLSSGDIKEATNCLRDLDVPHFHHEVVYEATVMVLEDSSERAAEMMCKLLKSFADAVIIMPQQFRQGLSRVYDNLPDISLDVPNAYPLLERFVNMCNKEGFISDALVKDLPQRGRKRFVSEGDGGKLKDQPLQPVSS